MKREKPSKCRPEHLRMPFGSRHIRFIDSTSWELKACKLEMIITRAPVGLEQRLKKQNKPFFDLVCVPAKNSPFSISH